MKKKIVMGISTGILLTLVGCTQKVVEKPVTETSKTSVEQVSKETQVSEEKVGATEVSIASIEEIISIYQGQFPDTDITSIQLEKELSGFVYQVEGVDDNNEHELKINAKTKEVMKDKTEKLDRDEQDGVKRNGDKLNLEGIISLDEATKLAEKEVRAGQAVEWDLDRELGTTYWEVKVKDGNKESKVKLDAIDGTVLQVELDD